MTPTLNLEELTLGAGSHSGPSDGMCVMEAAAYMAGEAWSDHPQCVSPVIATFLRSWNDSLPDRDRGQLVRYLANVNDGGVLGTAPAGPELENRRSWLAVDWSVRVHTPAWLRLAGLDDQATLLEQLPEISSTETATSIRPALIAVRKDAAAARAAARAAAWAAARAAAEDAAWDAARAAAWAAARAAAEDAARDAAGAAARDAAWAAAWAAARAAALAAAGDALAPTVAQMQESAHELVARMATATEEVETSVRCCSSRRTTDVADLTPAQRDKLDADLARAEHLAREHARILEGIRATLAGPPVDMLAPSFWPERDGTLGEVEPGDRVMLMGRWAEVETVRPHSTTVSVTTAGGGWMGRAKTDKVRIQKRHGQDGPPSYMRLPSGDVAYTTIRAGEVVPGMWINAFDDDQWRQVDSFRHVRSGAVRFTFTTSEIETFFLDAKVKVASTPDAVRMTQERQAQQAEAYDQACEARS